MKMTQLEQYFQAAKASRYKYVAVKVHMDGFPQDEIIINPIENFESKLEYYKKTYDENCVHKFSPNISIVDVDYEDVVDALKFFVNDEIRRFCK